MVKTVYDKRGYNTEEFRKKESSNWSELYQISHPKILMDKFTHFFVRRLQIHAPSKSVSFVMPIIYFHYQKNGYGTRLRRKEQKIIF